MERDKGGHVSTVTTSKGATAKFDSHGKVSAIHDGHGTTINHGVHGERKIVTERPNHSKLVSTGAHRGYVEHSFTRGGHEYVRRTTVVGGTSYVSVYRGYYYNGGVYYGYVPAYYYGPAYYGWAYNPWPAPVYYQWGWGGNPWYGYYGGYFTPYSAYPTAAFWLTDYLVAENLRLAYESQLAANAEAANAGAANATAAQGGGATLTPEIKQMIADEVKQQLAAEQQAASQPPAPAQAAPSNAQAASNQEVPGALDPNHRVFVVSANLDVTAANNSCALTPGDVIMRMENTPGTDNAVTVNVLSGKKADCPVGSAPRVQVSDLQEMHNHFRQQIDSGLGKLAENQGKNGIPSGPAAKAHAVAEGTAAPDLTVASDLQKQQQDADQTEKDVQLASANPGQNQ